MNRAITPAACLESIELRIDMDNKIIDKIQNLLELSSYGSKANGQVQSIYE